MMGMAINYGMNHWYHFLTAWMLSWKKKAKISLDMKLDSVFFDLLSIPLELRFSSLSIKIENQWGQLYINHL